MIPIIYAAVNKNGTELLSDGELERDCTKCIPDHTYKPTENELDMWSGGPQNNILEVPRGTIKMIIGKDLKFNDGCLQITPHNYDPH